MQIYPAVESVQLRIKSHGLRHKKSAGQVLLSPDIMSGGWRLWFPSSY